MAENAYEKYKKREDLPVTITLMVPPEGVMRKGIIQFHHGMGEHRGRYKEVLEFFKDHGYICAIHDARGHGDSMKNDSELGYFGENGADIVVEDTHAVTAFLKNNYPDLPLILIGHSFGSLVVRAYLKKYDYEVDRAFVIGCPVNNNTKSLCMLTIELLTIFRSDKEVSHFIANIMNNQYYKIYKKKCEEKHIKPIKFGQICSDEKVVEAYNKDPKCGFDYTYNGYYTISSVMTKVYNGSPSKWVHKNKNLKITFLSGAEDAYMVSEKKFLEAVNKMKQIGYDVDYKLYPGMYHEILNEKDKIQVYEDILGMIEEK